MTLAQYQRDLMHLLYTPEGRQSTKSDKALSEYLNKRQCSPDFIAQALKQPEGRIKQYQFMLLANAEEALKNIFPITAQLAAHHWPVWVEAFLMAYPPKSFHWWRHAEAFSDFVKTFETEFNAPYLGELARYEWLEAYLVNMPNQTVPFNYAAGLKPQNPEDLERLKPVINPTGQLLQAQFPVTLIAQYVQQHDVVTLDTLPSEFRNPNIQFLWLYRDSDPYQCRFFELNPLFAFWVQQCTAQQAEAKTIQKLVSYWKLLEPIWVGLHDHNPDMAQHIFQTQLLDAIGQLFEYRILLGSVE